MNDTKQQHIDKLMDKANKIYLDWLSKNFSNRCYVKRHIPMHIHVNSDEFKDECYRYSKTFGR